MQTYQRHETHVLVVGAGAAGLVTGLVLGDLGIPALIVERRPDASSHPRATALTSTTMNLIRDWGIETEVRRAGFESLHAMSIRASLIGPELDRVPFDDHVWTCAQDRLEPILSERARSAGAQIVYGCELTHLQPVEDGMLTTLLDRATGASRQVRARFVVGADGAYSRVRAEAGITLARSRNYGDWMSILFRAPLRDYTGDPPYMVYGITNTEPIGVITPTDATDRWIRGIPWHSEAGERVEDYNEARCSAIIRSAVGVKVLSVVILAVQAFRMAAALANSYRAGRVLLVGDAAHIFTPSTGMGLNIAIQDGLVAAQCLARAIQNGIALDVLDAYGAERRPVAERALASELSA